MVYTGGLRWHTFNCCTNTLKSECGACSFFQGYQSNCLDGFTAAPNSPCFTSTQDLGVLLWSHPGKRLMVVSPSGHDEVRRFWRRHRSTWASLTTHKAHSLVTARHRQLMTYITLCMDAVWYHRCNHHHSCVCLVYITLYKVNWYTCLHRVALILLAVSSIIPA